MTKKKTYVDAILYAVNCSRSDDALLGSGTPKWPQIYKDYEELARRLQIACEFLRKDYAYKDKWDNEARELADQLEALPEEK